eukprot:CAMPEP_0171932524 /NCGR_PEP_ID=MMETSP0993-20121228/30452_1 /TAXON_ID=483369 /ORGANISM="non described non described, Strain CCMP2098" /LENGTH=65 /DNA_ID=CAMNT_0012572833 /DNA_START=12 /DNA_END=209 /DNA_ORIENTATION=-
MTRAMSIARNGFVKKFPVGVLNNKEPYVWQKTYARSVSSRKNAALMPKLQKNCSLMTPSSSSLLT